MPAVHVTDDALVIRIRHPGLRLLAIILAIVSIVGFTNPKKPDGPMLGVFFAVAAVLVAWASESLTISMQRSTDHFEIRRGGFFGLGARSVQQPLGTIARAEREVKSGSGFTNSHSGSRLAFVTRSGDRLPLTFAYSTTGMAGDRELVDAINSFLKPKRAPSFDAQPVDAHAAGGSELRTALVSLLGQPDSFIIIEAGNAEEFVQVSCDEKGLGLFWPGAGTVVGELADRAEERLRALGFRQIAYAPGALEAMRKDEYAVADDGVYASFGRDVDRAETFTRDAFANVFGKPDATLHFEIDS